MPTWGEISFRDHSLANAGDDALTGYRRQHVGFVFQFYNLIPSLMVAENVALVTDIAAEPMPVDEALGLVALMPRRQHFPSQLSDGEQQRVVIARAIAKRPQLLLCDEPTGALDYAIGKLVLEVIARINQEPGTTAVVITHNAAIAAMADRVVRVADGRVVGMAALGGDRHHHRRPGDVDGHRRHRSSLTCRGDAATGTGRYRPALLERLVQGRLTPALRMILRNIERRPLRSALTTDGIAAAVAIVIVGNFFRDTLDAIVDSQFTFAMRGDVVVWMMDVVDAAAGRELARLPGVPQVETGRRVAVRFSHGQANENGNIEGRTGVPSLQRIVDSDGHVALPGTYGVVMTDRLAAKLRLRPGGSVTVELREGRRQVRQVLVERTVSDMMGLNAFIGARINSRLRRLQL